MTLFYSGKYFFSISLIINIFPFLWNYILISERVCRKNFKCYLWQKSQFSSANTRVSFAYLIHQNFSSTKLYWFQCFCRISGRIFFFICDSSYTWNCHWYSVQISSQSTANHWGESTRGFSVCQCRVLHVQPKVAKRKSSVSVSCLFEKVNAL